MTVSKNETVPIDGVEANEPASDEPPEASCEEALWRRDAEYEAPADGGVNSARERRPPVEICAGFEGVFLPMSR